MKKNMLRHQLQACGVLDNEILDLMEHTSRIPFIPEEYHSVPNLETHIYLNDEEISN